MDVLVVVDVDSKAVFNAVAEVFTTTRAETAAAKAFVIRIPCALAAPPDHAWYQLVG